MAVVRLAQDAPMPRLRDHLARHAVEGLVGRTDELAALLHCLQAGVLGLSTCMAWRGWVNRPCSRRSPLQPGGLE